MGNSASIDIVGKNDKLKKSLDDSENMIKTFASSMKRAMQATLALFVVDKVFEFGKSLVDNAAEAELAFSKLDSAIEATGHSAGFTSDTLAEFADHLEGITNFSSEASQEAMAVIATFKEIKGDNFLAATKAAQDMSTVLGGDLSGAAMQLGKALNDPIKGLTALSRSGVSFTQEQEDSIRSLVKMGKTAEAQKIILEELNNEFGGAAEKAGSTFIGQLGNIGDALGSVGDNVGETLLEILADFGASSEGIVAFLVNLTPYLQDMIKWVANVGKSIFTFIQPALEFLVDVGITAFTAVSFAIQNFGKIADYTLTAFWYSVESTFNYLYHFITEVIPSSLSWLGENWSEIFTDIGTFTGTVLVNMGKNIYDFFVQVKNLFSGKGFKFEFTALTEGFESAIKKLPEIAKRIPSAIEISLKDKMDTLGEELGNTFTESLGDNMNEFKNMFTKKNKQPTFDRYGREVTDPPKNEEKPKNTSTGVAGDSKDGKSSGSGTKDSEFKSSTEDLAALNKRIQNSAASDPNKPLIDSTKGLIEQEKKVEEGLFELNKTLRGAEQFVAFGAGNAIKDNAGAAASAVHGGLLNIGKFFKTVDALAQDKANLGLQSNLNALGNMFGIKPKESVIGETERDSWLRKMAEAQAVATNATVTTGKKQVEAVQENTAETKKLGKKLDTVGLMK